LILAQPLASRTGDKPMTALPAECQRVVIRGSAIEVLSVEYRPKHAAAAAPQQVPVVTPQQDRSGSSQRAASQPPSS
jgi:hypothetical protein